MNIAINYIEIFYSRQKIDLAALKLVTRLLKNILSSPDAEITKGNLIQNLAYGKKENIIKSMSDCKMSDIIFTLASSLGGDIIYAFKEGNKDDTSVIFADIFSIIAAIFDGIDVPNLILKSRSVIAEDLNSKRSFKKPIRHGRFSGSVCVQLSVITECLSIYSYYNFRRVKIWLLAIATCLHRELPDL